MKQRNDGSIYQPVQPPKQLRDSGSPLLTLVPDQPNAVGATVDGKLQWASLGPLDLEKGGHLENVDVAYRTWGTLDEQRSNAVFILHALTGDSQAAGSGGWWEPLIGKGRVIDTEKLFVVCANILGGCQGTTGPASLDPLTHRPYAMRFPFLTIGDIVSVQSKLATSLGLDRVMIVGGSIGGCQALEWATRFPEQISGTVAIGATPALGPQAIALLEAGRRAIMADPDWRGGEYASEGTFPGEGLAIARMIMMTQFHSAESMQARFGRNPATRPSLYPGFGGTFDVEGYIHYHGASLVRRFDANSHLYLTRAMDLFDLYRDGGADYWLDRIDAPLLLVGIRSDWLYPPVEIEELADRIDKLDKSVQYHEIDSPNGHDSFLKDWDLMNEALGRFMAEQS